jgi:Flp pilus assembly protein TadG
MLDMARGELSVVVGKRRTKVASERGSELVEAALVVTIVLSLLIGIFWIARGYNVYQSMRRAVREGARFAVAPSCATCGNAYPTDDEIRAVIAAALQADHLDPALADPNPIPIQHNVVLNPGSYVEERGVVINFDYPVEIFLPFTPVELTTLTLTASVQMREEK